MESKARLSKIGNSKGVIIPERMLEEAGISDLNEELILESGKEGILIKPVKTEIRKGWAESFKQMRENNDDHLLFPDAFEDENLEEWK